MRLHGLLLAHRHGSELIQDSLETSTDDVDQLLEGAAEETRSHGYGIRTAVVAGFEVTNPLRRIDDLLERARSDLVAMAAAENASAAAKEATADDQGAVDAAGARGPPKAADVAAMLAQVAEASAVVRGDVLARLQKERSRNAEYVLPVCVVSHGPPIAVRLSQVCTASRISLYKQAGNFAAQSGLT